MQYKKLSVFVITGALIASTGASAFGEDYKTSIKLVLKSGTPSTEMIYDEAYTLAIPEALTITNEGWNSIGNMTASYSGTNDGFDPEKKLVVTVSSANGFTLKAGGASDGVTYLHAAKEGDSSSAITFTFTAEKVNAGISQPVGVIVNDFSKMADGIYTDEITYTVEVQDAAN